jgi:hypothetical protein
LRNIRRETEVAVREVKGGEGRTMKSLERDVFTKYCVRGIRIMAEF